MIYCQQISYGQNMTALFDTLLNYMHNKYNFDGVVLVADNNLIIYKKAFGLANRDWNISNTTDTKFRLGSVSKQFIGFVTLKLAEEGKLKLEDPVSKYLPGFNSSEKKNITIQNLLTHTSGVFNYTSMPDFNSMVLYQEDSLVKMIASHKLNFQPSTKYSYSNSNFYLLTVIAEKISGENFETILKEKILTPARMNNSGIEHNDHVLSNRASPYTFTATGFVNGEYIQMDNVAAGMYSTADDMMSWSLFMQKQIKSDKFLRAALQPFHLVDGTTSIYSCGWCLLPDKMMHQGHINGFANHISIDTLNRYTVIILSNDDFKELFATGKIISSILHGNNEASNYLIQKNSSQQLNEYTGVYALGSDTIFNKVENGELVSYFNGEPLIWKPFAKDEFFCELFEGNILFERNKANVIIGTKSFEDYNWIEYKKVK